MIVKDSLLYYIKEQENDLLKQIQSIQKECSDSLRDMNYAMVISSSVDLHTLRSELSLLESLESRIDSGFFDVPETSSCCGGECEKQ